MAIIEKSPVRIPSIDDVVRQIKSQNYDAYQQLRRVITFGYMNVWKNPNYTPEEIVEAFGTDGEALFGLSYQAQILLKSIDPSYEILNMPDGYSVAFDNGVATLTKQ